MNPFLFNFCKQATTTICRVLDIPEISLPVKREKIIVSRLTALLFQLPSSIGASPARSMWSPTTQTRIRINGRNNISEAMVSYTNNTFILPPSSYLTLTASNTTTSTSTSTISHDYQEHDYDSHHHRRRRRLSPPIIKCRCN